MSFTQQNEFRTEYCMWRKKSGEKCMYPGYCKHKCLSGCSIKNKKDVK